VPHLKQLSSDIPKEVAIKAFVDIHTNARRIRVPGLSTAFRQMSLHLTRILLSQGAEDVILENYRASFVNFFTRKNTALHSDFFEGFLRHHRSFGWKFREDILELSGKALNGHRKSQAFQFLLILFPVISAEVTTYSCHPRAANN
jgi:DNA polymerase phi